ncbi:TBC1 domain family member 20 [Psilocybe cubensis]|uniref:Rab-GAP TBC domain-containing protein n=2 Tax=Psilocybe cubensis TaxID=181762 RepID=A0A8H7XZ00_PSICU|nr:TBC1 domain family member 20 [Psilocybe cubensis]KAH9478599.1 TBC1 domain family member 20 [Psilocybe cubensis]
MTVDNVSATHRKHKHQKIDWNDLRARSLQKGGFGDERVDLWPKILNVAKPKDFADEKSRRPTESKDEVVHQDERQIGLDTDRSFVLYPVDSNTDKETLQAELHKLLVSIFRKRPRLSYFQGYHDIVTVLFLTLPPEMQLVCAEKLSLHRLRDSMGSGLEPVLGLLRVTSKLLHLADPEFAQLLERNSPLPFYALSNLLTLFSHDIPTLPLIQHVFDYLFCRPPIAVVYLATAVILSRKKEVIRLEEEDEDGMIHSLLSSLPNLADDIDEEDIIDIRPTPWKSDESPEADTSNTFFKEENDPDQIMLNNSSPYVDSTVKVESENPMDYVQNDGNRLPDSRSHSPSPTNSHEGISDNTGNATPLEHVHDDDSLSNKRDETQPKEEDADQSTRPLSETIPPVELSPPINEPTKEENHDCDIVSTIHHKPERIYLTDLLRRADALYKEFPPSHPGLALSSIMGPQSVVFTWSESFSELPSDNTAEAMVSHPELVVYPYVEIDPHQKEEGSSDDKDEKSPGGGKKSRRKRRKLRKSPFGQMEKKTMLAGTVLVLGVAMAVYGIKARNAHPSHGLLYGIAEGRGHKDWRRVSGWVGGALAGMSEKIMNGLSSGS